MRHMIAITSNWFTPQMLVAFAIFGTLPLWLEGVGLYSYIGLEVLIWIIFALGFNLLLGYTRPAVFRPRCLPRHRWLRHGLVSDQRRA